MNVRPAPFGMIESVVAATLGARPTDRRLVVRIALHDTKLMDEVKGLSPADVPALLRPDCTSVSPEPSSECDGSIEPPRVAPREAAKSAPVEVPNPWPAGQPILSPVERIRAECAAEAADRQTRFREATRLTTAHPLPAERTRVPAVGPNEHARRSDGFYRGAKDRDARELEAPVDSAKLADRRELIRVAAAKIVRRKEADRAGRLSLGERQPRRAFVAPKVSPELHLRSLQGAIAFLKARCILVSVLDRDALVRRYRVSGRRDSVMADDVIAIAAEHGFEVAA